MKVIVRGAALSQCACPGVWSITRFGTPGDAEALQVQLVVIPDCGCRHWHTLDKGTVAGSPSENGMGH